MTKWKKMISAPISSTSFNMANFLFPHSVSFPLGPRTHGADAYEPPAREAEWKIKAKSHHNNNDDAYKTPRITTKTNKPTQARLINAWSYIIKAPLAPSTHRLLGWSSLVTTTKNWIMLSKSNKIAKLSSLLFQTKKKKLQHIVWFFVICLCSHRYYKKILFLGSILVRPGKK